MFVSFSTEISSILRKYQIGGKQLDPSVLEIETDSRKNLNGKLFICFKGPNFDGHEFAHAALKAGAIGVVCEKPIKSSFTDKYVGVVPSALQFFSKLAHIKRKSLQTKVIAMTGSVGKTSIRSILECCLQEYGIVYATKGNNNNEIGVPKTILECPEDVDFLILEHGARVKDDIAKLVAVSHPDVAILLNAKESHLGPFGNFENLVKTKRQILDYQKSKRVVYADQAEFSDLIKDSVSFGISQQASVRVEEEPNPGSFEFRKFRFYLNGSRDTVQVKHKFPHKPFGLNLAACLATGLALNLDPHRFFSKLPLWKPVQGRFHIEKRGTNIVIDDTYNASPSSVMAGLETVIKSYPSYQKVLILGEMKELGVKSDEEHLKLLRFVLEELQPNHLWFVGDNAQELVESDLTIADAFNKNGSYRAFKGVSALQTSFTKLLEEVNGGVFFLKASRSVGLDKLLDKS